MVSSATCDKIFDTISVFLFLFFFFLEGGGSLLHNFWYSIILLHLSAFQYMSLSCFLVPRKSASASPQFPAAGRPRMEPQNQCHLSLRQVIHLIIAPIIDCEHKPLSLLTEFITSGLKFTSKRPFWSRMRTLKWVCTIINNQQFTYDILENAQISIVGIMMENSSEE